MKIRLTGTPSEVQAAALLIGSVLTVTSTSRPYPRRDGNGESVYLDGRLAAERDAVECLWCFTPVDGQGTLLGGAAWSCRRCTRVYGCFLGLVAVAETVDPSDLEVDDWARLDFSDWSPVNMHRLPTGRVSRIRPSTAVRLSTTPGGQLIELRAAASTEQAGPGGGAQ